MSQREKNASRGEMGNGEDFWLSVLYRHISTIIYYDVENDVLHLKLFFSAEISVFPKAFVKRLFLFNIITPVLLFIFT